MSAGVPRGTTSRSAEWGSRSVGRITFAGEKAFRAYVERDARDRFECQVWRLLNMETAHERDLHLAGIAQHRDDSVLVDRLRQESGRMYSDMLDELLAMPRHEDRAAYLVVLEREGDRVLADRLRNAAWAKLRPAAPVADLTEQGALL